MTHPLPPGAGPRILLAPVTVSPTKPLTPTHLKYLLSLDVIVRVSAVLADVTVAYQHGAYAGSQQVAGFWDHLDRHHPGTAYAGLDEVGIGELYVAYHRTPRLPFAAIEPTVRRAEAGWLHPASARLLDIWRGHYELLGMFDPDLGRHGPELMAEADLLDLLVRRNLCIDGRPVGAPVYLDATAAGHPLRVVLGADGQPNYLLYLLRELVPLLADHDLVVLAHDEQLRADYQTVSHVLTALGARVVRFEVPRVPIDGVTTSTRFGGWQGYTLDAIADRFVDDHGVDAFRLGLRLYLIAGLGRTARENYSAHQLSRWIRRARRLLDVHAGADDHDAAGERVPAELWGALVARRGYADPYRVATTLMSRQPTVPVGALLDVVTGPARSRATVGGAR
ncbi:hypothetical protein OG767_20765 [Micromonospora sp. NBC_01392]|uniref:hypothetical protein n=1 Tax=Micromonospora sp. NBC_01392 TaxID=2903588 RepID=UPI0032443050